MQSVASLSGSVLTHQDRELTELELDGIQGGMAPKDDEKEKPEKKEKE
ncbi:hypothetical protein [Tuwongella immobilis]|nr:hypothetical protein [Tuwongella immobilis]